jgi:hypothetical protein
MSITRMLARWGHVLVSIGSVHPPERRYAYAALCAAYHPHPDGDAFTYLEGGIYDPYGCVRPPGRRVECVLNVVSSTLIEFRGPWWEGTIEPCTRERHPEFARWIRDMELEAENRGRTPREELRRLRRDLQANDRKARLHEAEARAARKTTPENR